MSTGGGRLLRPHSSPVPTRHGTKRSPRRSQPSTNIHPPLSHTFYRLRKTLSESFPELLETLNGPVDDGLLTSFEQELGCPLPPSVRESLMIADGQDLDSGCGGLFFGLHMLPLEDIMREWAFWRHAEHDPMTGKNPAVLATMASIPPTWIKSQYACRGWIPLLSDRTGNYVGVDLDPGVGGSWGQVIVFGRDFDRKCVIWRGDGEGGWGKFFAGYVDELESGHGWEADKSSSSDEEEELGYGSYNGGATAGEAGRGLRLAGEYRGWNVLEAWWDRSVRQWEQLGLGMDVEEIERGLSEARRLAGLQGQSEDVAGDQGRSAESSSQGDAPGECGIVLTSHTACCLTTQLWDRPSLLNNPPPPYRAIRTSSSPRPRLKLPRLICQSSSRKSPSESSPPSLPLRSIRCKPNPPRRPRSHETEISALASSHRMIHAESDLRRPRLRLWIYRPEPMSKPPRRSLRQKRAGSEADGS